MKNIILLIIVCLVSSCVAPNALEIASPKVDLLKMEDSKFTSPSDGTKFHLTLGKQLDSYDRGVTSIPEGVTGDRNATASYYSIKNKQGTMIGKAESAIAEGFEHKLKFIEIQHERSSGRILVTEDTSDAFPSKRYILFTPMNPGYSVDYLGPIYESNFEGQGFPDPPRINLLPEDKAWVGGKILSISDILKSKHPFSVGG